MTDPVVGGAIVTGAKILAAAKATSEIAKETKRIMEWIEQGKKKFEKFKPRVLSVTIDHRRKKVEMSYFLYAPKGMRRKVTKVSVTPKEELRVVEMLDENFNVLTGLWSCDERGRWVLKPSSLPKDSERFRLRLEGPISSDVLEGLLTLSRSETAKEHGEYDAYWLSCGIRDPRTLRELWEDLKVEGILLKQYVGIDACFSTSMPKPLVQVIKANSAWLGAGGTRDRHFVFDAWRKRRLAERRAKDAQMPEILDGIVRLTNEETFKKYVLIDSPFTLGDIVREEKFWNLWPQKMRIEAVTSLSYERKLVEGELRFHRDRFNADIEDSMEGLMKSKSRKTKSRKSGRTRSKRKD